MQSKTLKLKMPEHFNPKGLQYQLKPFWVLPCLLIELKILEFHYSPDTYLVYISCVFGPAFIADAKIDG